MLFDLSGDQRMTPMVGTLYAAVHENHQRLHTITEGMSQGELAYQVPNHAFNSTAQLTNHLTYVDIHWVYRINHLQLPASLEAMYGPARDQHRNLPMVQGYSLQTLLSHYQNVIDELATSCAQLTDDDLTRVVAFDHENEKQATIRWGIWHMADHSRYHQANINLLRQWYIKHGGRT